MTSSLGKQITLSQDTYYMLVALAAVTTALKNQEKLSKKVGYQSNWLFCNLPMDVAQDILDNIKANKLEES